MYLVILPVVGVRGVVHPYFEILSAREEEVAVVGELAGVAARIVMYNHVCGRRRDKILDSVRLYTRKRLNEEEQTCSASVFVLL